MSNVERFRIDVLQFGRIFAEMAPVISHCFTIHRLPILNAFLVCIFGQQSAVMAEIREGT